jgi:DNA repair protein RecO (recombination protein O)
MVELTKYLGFEPQNDYNEQQAYFDCRNGCFSTMSLAFPLGLNKTDSLLFSEFLKVNGLKAKLSNEQRRNLLDVLLSYYALHIPGFKEIKSLEVLKEVMAV